MKKAPDPIDIFVGTRVRMQRSFLGLSQEKLGDALDLTFQQVQKYEKGTNRIGASRLYAIAMALKVPPAFFFEGLPTAGEAEAEGSPALAAAEAGSAYVVDFLSTSEGLRLNRGFARIHDAKVRKRVVDLVKTLAGDDDT